MEKLCERRMVPKVMDEFDCAALLDESGIKIWQWRKIQQCLKLFMDVPQFGVAEKHLRALGVDHGEIKHGTYDWQNACPVSNVMLWDIHNGFSDVQMKGVVRSLPMSSILFSRILFSNWHWQ